MSRTLGSHNLPVSGKPRNQKWLVSRIPGSHSLPSSGIPGSQELLVSGIPGIQESPVFGTLVSRLFTVFFKLHSTATAFKATMNKKNSVNLLFTIQIHLVHDWTIFLTSLFKIDLYTDRVGLNFNNSTIFFKIPNGFRKCILVPGMKEKTSNKSCATVPLKVQKTKQDKFDNCFRVIIIPYINN